MCSNLGRSWRRGSVYRSFIILPRELPSNTRVGQIISSFRKRCHHPWFTDNQATWNGTNRPLSLVLVDGLDGDPVQTWTHKATDVCWPKDLMPAVRPRTIVLSFGYNGDMYRNNSVLGIRDNARWLLSALCDHRSDMATLRPVIFVGHCLGGLIVKQVGLKFLG